MAVTYESVVVRQGDSLPVLAAKYLGSQSRWREIAALNKMRAPYISDKVADQYGTPLTIGILGDDIAIGDTETTILGERAEIIEHGTILFLDGLDGDSHYVYDALAVDSYDETTGALALLDAARYTWAVGTRYRICPVPQELDTIVARSGTTIALPIVASGTASQIVSTEDLVNILGTDIALGTDGRLSLVGGDLVTVGGVDNAGQALWMRATLVYGQAIWHPEEGNLAYIMIGEPLIQTNTDIAALYTRRALSTDPRLAEVPSVGGFPDGGGAIQIDASCVLIDRSTEVRVNAILREG